MKKKILIAVDMQADFISGSLGTAEAEEMIPRAAARIDGFQGQVIFTQDTHGSDYLTTQEGANLPVEHCIEGTPGWEIDSRLRGFVKDAPVKKNGFGSIELAERLRDLNEENGIESITLIGLCTDICVISNAMIIKAMLPEVPVFVDADCCAGVTPASHSRALAAMEACQIKIVGR